MKSNLKDILDSDETIIWEGKPTKSVYTLGTIISNLIWLIILCFFAGIMLLGVGAKEGDKIGLNNWHWLLLIFVVIYCILVIYRMKYYETLEYAYTNKRVFVKGGVFGTDYNSVDYSAIENIDVNVTVLQKMFKCGTVIFRGAVSHNLVSIKEPYEVFKSLKTVAFDVKTDIYYPNNLRPDENNGYKTKYKKED